eukprot:COSAG01_NODE_4884_length_4653_cov_20.654370_2_plen_59_part_00
MRASWLRWTQVNTQLMDVPAQGKKCFSTGRAFSAKDQSCSPPILEDYPFILYMYTLLP